MTSKPQTREAVLDLLHQAVRGAVTGVLHNDSVQRSCISCANFDEPKELCKLYKARPPARIIAYSCPDYVDPFEVPY